MLCKDLYATLTGLFDDQSSESIKIRLQRLHWSSPARMDLDEEQEIQSILENQHSSDLADECTFVWTGRLVSDTISGLANGPTGIGPWGDLLRIKTDWHDKVLEIHSARSALNTLLAKASPHTWCPNPMRMA
ncbi:hypothetical protein D915_006034 [Fasciola hepatica]|uniref:Uncharacterized protein n=1 Tax=Fasciola hepatica TaxID=6192 RepID=A0A4E0R8T8_FASHE|nr:hypothetical protein D915_006034 [Fasciola hepatica]